MLSADDAAEAARLLQLLLASQSAEVDQGAPDKERLRQLAKSIYLGRQARSQFLPAGLDGEPAWDMLLALYARDSEGVRHSTTTVAEFAGSALTTALRWLDYLADHGLVVKEPSPSDRRQMLVSLTDRARQRLDSYFSSLVEYGLGG